GKDAVKEATGAVTAMHMADAKAFLRSADRYLAEGDELEFGEFAVRVIHTPGHSPGSLCYLVVNHLFTRDTLLAGGIARHPPRRRRPHAAATAAQDADLPGPWAGHKPGERAPHPPGLPAGPPVRHGRLTLVSALG